MDSIRKSRYIIYLYDISRRRIVLHRDDDNRFVFEQQVYIQSQINISYTLWKHE